MNETNIKFLSPSGEIKNIKVYFANAQPWFIELSLDGEQTVKLEGRDLFDCLCALRTETDALGIKILCNGARIDAFPSPMLQSSGARKVYITEIGKQALRENLVNIFEEAPAEKVGTVEDQFEYHTKWIDSLG
jgi:hypothetical protein